MDRIEWFLGLIAYLLAAIVLEFGIDGFILYELSIIIILYSLAIYLIVWPIYTRIA